MRRIVTALLIIVLVALPVGGAVAECTQYPPGVYTWYDASGWSSSVNAYGMLSVTHPDWGFYGEYLEGAEVLHVFVDASGSGGDSGGGRDYHIATGYDCPPPG